MNIKDEPRIKEIILQDIYVVRNSVSPPEHYLASVEFCYGRLGFEMGYLMMKAIISRFTYGTAFNAFGMH
jgi:hypothetical protein